jgi:DNA-binding ferritin-like protein
MEKRMLKRNPEPTKTISRPEITVTQPKSEPAKAQPTPSTGVGGSSLDTMVSACATELMNARTSIHKLHLKVTGEGSFAAHTALNDLYDALPGHADTLVEGYQGAAEKILELPNTAASELNNVEEGLDFLRKLYTKIESLQSSMPYSEIVNDLDNIKSTINSIKYKLLFLK